MKEGECPVYAPPDYPDNYGYLMDWAMDRVKDPDKKVFLRLSGTDTALTYSEFASSVNKICNLLKETGVQKGDHVAVFLPSCVEYAWLYHSLGKCGAVMAPINPFVRGEPLEYILKHSDSKYLVTTDELFREKVSRIEGLMGSLEVIYFVNDKEEVQGIRAVSFADYQDYSADFERDVRVTGDDIQGIWYTSGTTGLPKGSVITHKNYMYRVLYFADYFRVTEEDVIYYILPMYHIGYAGWGGPLAMAAGAEIVQVPWFSASKFWKEVVQFGATVTFSTGTIIPIMLNQPVTEEEIKGRKQIRMWTGWPVDDPQRVKERWPNIKFLEAYGTTEAPCAAISDFDNPEIGDAGPPTVYTDLKIIDPESGKEVPRGKVGEIVYSHKLGPGYILKGYYKDLQKTRETIRDGYWYSGDLGMINEKGHLQFADRLKDYLRVGGENVSSAVVEDVIRKHPDVSEVAIVGSRGELGHDEIVAHVVPKDGSSLDPREFFTFCNDNMAYFMVPKYLVIRSELPKTGTMRIEKYRLREEGVPSNAIDRNKLGIVLKR